MQLDQMSETRTTALQKWREYKDAEKQSSNPLYKDLRKIYNQIKSGKKVIDIFKVIQKGGVHENFHPKLAIAQAKTKKITCEYFQHGLVKFINDDSWRRRISTADVILENCLPKFQMQNSFANQKITAPVPLIPPKFLPKVLTEDYYILWEVDVWKMIPPTDPWLLRRITKTMFVVLAGWDLTEIEKAVMAGRMI